MNQSNACPQCGGVGSHVVTDINGKRYYHCTRGLTYLEDDRIYGKGITRGGIRPCDTVIHQGRVFSGTIAYSVEGGVKTLMVTSGKMR